MEYKCKCGNIEPVDKLIEFNLRTDCRDNIVLECCQCGHEQVILDRSDIVVHIQVMP